MQCRRVIQYFVPVFCLVSFIGVNFTGFEKVAIADDSHARAIMQKVDDRENGETSTADMEMILIDKQQHTRTRIIRSFAKDIGEDTYSMMFFKSPADIKDTAFLTYDYDQADKADDQWLFLPALKKTKRIASGDKSGSFMGSDFSYADMATRDLEEYDYTLKQEMEVKGKKVWVIEALPRSKQVITETGYTKSLLFIRQDNHFIIRAIHWQKKGKKLKYFDVVDLQKIDNIWTPMEMHMSTKKGKKTIHKTIMKFANIQYNGVLDDAMFTIRHLEKGL